MIAPSLRAEGICKRYPGVQVLKDVSFDCQAGEIHAVVGENGSGKSTLLGIISGAIVADAGVVEVLGERLRVAHPAAARRMGLAAVYQDSSLVPDLTVAENLYLAAPSWDRPQFSDRVEWAREKLTQYAAGLADPHAPVGSLSAAQAQFLEIIKALLRRPKVLLLDEPTTALSVDEIVHLQTMVRKLAAEGAAVVYVSHRLREVLELANRVTVLRDGQHQGTYSTVGLREEDVVSLMIGNPIHLEFPAKGMRPPGEAEVALSAQQLRGATFGPIDLQLRKGEILGLAGAEGNGQREVARALAGVEPATGSLMCYGHIVDHSSPYAALKAGIMMLSGDRARESVFPELGVRQNMTVQVLDSFGPLDLLVGNRELDAAADLIERLGIATPDLDKPVRQLSGGNQQKTVLGRAFLCPARVLCVDEPTQGVDAKARLDIYRALRAKADEGVSVVVKSADALELAGLCDRVLVFSRGRIIKEIGDGYLSEESIVGSFVGADDRRTSAEAGTTPAEVKPKGTSSLSSLFAPSWLPMWVVALFVAFLGVYTATQAPVFLTPVNLRYVLLATVPVAFVAMGQLLPLLVGGFDISIGSTMSLVIVTLSLLVPDGASPVAIVAAVVVCVAIGAVVGLGNGSFVRATRVNPFIATIASMSIIQGVALILRPVVGGPISVDYQDALNLSIGFVPWAFVVLVLGVVGADFWLHRTGGGLRARAVGFHEEAARRNGVSTGWVRMRSYVLCGALAAVAGLFLGAQVGVGHPTIGMSMMLASIIAPVLAGASLFGGKGSFFGTLLGALFLSMVLNTLTLMHTHSATATIVYGLLILVAVLIYSRGGALRRG